MPTNRYFVDHYKHFAEDDKLSALILTGDISMSGKSEEFESIVKLFNSIGKPYYVAPGNHDLLDEKGVYDSFFKERYYSFKIRKDLFIVLDSNDGWSIKGDQLEFLKTTLKNPKKYNNIFLFTHQLIWYKKFKYFHFNSKSGLEEPTNYYEEIEPLLAGLGKKVFFFSGDVGAWYNPFYYYVDKNITYIASGMTNFKEVKEENYIRVDVDKNWGC